jgi:hypothetical protein
MSDTHEIKSEDNGGNGRRWHDVRPKPRRRADLMGFNSTLWMALGWVILFLVLLFPYPWYR